MPIDAPLACLPFQNLSAPVLHCTDLEITPMNQSHCLDVDSDPITAGQRKSSADDVTRPGPRIDAAVRDSCPSGVNGFGPPDCRWRIACHLHAVECASGVDVEEQKRDPQWLAPLLGLNRLLDPAGEATPSVKIGGAARSAGCSPAL